MGGGDEDEMDPEIAAALENDPELIEARERELEAKLIPKLKDALEYGLVLLDDLFDEDEAEAAFAPPADDMGGGVVDAGKEYIAGPADMMAGKAFKPSKQ